MGTQLTVEALADALDCYWNAALGEAHRQQDSAALAVAATTAEGFAAMSRRLREFAEVPPVQHPPTCECADCWQAMEGGGRG